MTMTMTKELNKNEYMKLITQDIDLPSGAKWKIKMMDSPSMMYLLQTMPEEGLIDEDTTKKFIIKNLVDIAKYVVVPNIVEPKGIEADQIFYLDVITLFSTLVEISGVKDDATVSPPTPTESANN